MKKESRTKFAFYIFIGLLGFSLLLIDTTPGHNIWGHFTFFRENLDAVEGIILIFFSGFHIGKSKLR